MSQNIFCEQKIREIMDEGLQFGVLGNQANIDIYFILIENISS